MSTLTWKRHLSKLYRPASKGDRRIILLYHAVGNGRQAIIPELFSEQIRWLSQHVEVLSLTNLLQATPKDGIRVALSFDDGYACLYTEVVPVLAKYNMPAIVYINPNWISEVGRDRKQADSALGHYADEAFLSWSEVKQLLIQGWEIGSHGADHIDLTRCDSTTVRQQLGQSKDVIERQLNRSCPHFAYTWGRHSKRVRQAVKQSQYVYAVAGHHKALSKRDNHFALPRMNIEKMYSMQDFSDIIWGRWDYLQYIQRLKRLTQ